LKIFYIISLERKRDRRWYDGAEGAKELGVIEASTEVEVAIVVKRSIVAL